MTRTSITRAVAVFSLTALGFLGLPAARALAISNAPDSTWRTNGKVYALAHQGNTMYVGGHFSKVLSPDGNEIHAVANLAAFNMATGAWIP